MNGWERLFLLRNLIMIVVAIASILVAIPFGFDIDLQEAVVVILLLGLINLASWLKLRNAGSINDRAIMLQLIIDVLGMSIFFYFTGSIFNPFIWFLLLPLLLAATLLPRGLTWVIAIQTILAYTLLLALDSLTTSQHAAHQQSFHAHVIGMWLGFIFCAGFVSTLLVSMADKLRAKRDELLKNEKLVAMGTLAAGAAHELGTPLGTIALVADELQADAARERLTARSVSDGALLIKSQIERCKEALSVLSMSAGEARMEGGSVESVDAFFATVIAQWQSSHPGQHLRLGIEPTCDYARIIGEKTLSQALISLLDNASDASHDLIEVRVTCQGRSLQLDIIDDGPGFEEHIFVQAGQQPIEGAKSNNGLGIGLFLAFATIQRLGGSLSISKRDPQGSEIRITLPLADNEIQGS